MTIGSLMTLAPAAELQIKQTCTPDIVAFTSLLVLPSADLLAQVDAVVERNPSLIRESSRLQCRVCVGRGCPACRSGPPPSSGNRLASDVPTGPTPRDRLRADAARLVHPSDRPLLDRLVDSLDDQGLLRRADRHALGASDQQIDRVIGVLRRAGHQGVGASDVVEYLLLQIDEGPDGPLADLARRLIVDHPDVLRDGRHGALAEALGVGDDQLRAVLAWMRSSLRPSAVALDAPVDGSGFAPPDVAIFENPQRPGHLAVEVLERRHIRLRIDEGFRRLMLDDAWVADQVAEAERFLNLLNRRWTTLRRVAVAAVRVQHPWITGRGPRRDLSRADVARALRCHQSTVSRAVADRRLLMPSGTVVPFSDLFQTGTGARDAIARLVADEDHASSDAELAAALCERGFTVARRTVAKYRHQLGIPPACERELRTGDDQTAVRITRIGRSCG